MEPPEGKGSFAAGAYSKRRRNGGGVMATVGDILAAKGEFVSTIGPNETVLEAARRMNSRRIGALVVVSDDRVMGMFTERDILTRVVVAQLDPGTTTVTQVMTSPVVCCRRDTDVGECKRIMTMRRIRHLPVVDNQKLIGIITTGDLMASEVDDHKEKIDYLHQYIYGTHTKEKTV